MDMPEFFSNFLNSVSDVLKTFQFVYIQHVTWSNSFTFNIWQLNFMDCHLKRMLRLSKWTEKDISIIFLWDVEEQNILYRAFNLLRENVFKLKKR